MLEVVVDPCSFLLCTCACPSSGFCAFGGPAERVPLLPSSLPRKSGEQRRCASTSNSLHPRPARCIMSYSLHHVQLFASYPTHCIMSYTLHHVLCIMSSSLHHVLHVASCPSYHVLLIASCPTRCIMSYASCPARCIMSYSLHHVQLFASYPTRSIMSSLHHVQLFASYPTPCFMSYTLHHVLRIMSYSLHHVLHVASCPSYHLLLIASCPMHHVLLVASRPFVSCPSCWTLCTLSSIVTLRAKVCLHVLSWRHHGEKHAHAFTVHSQTLSCTHTYMRTANTLIYTLFGCPS